MGIRSLIILLLSTSKVYAASCCGGGSSLPSLITGDYRAQFSITGNNSGVTHDSDPAGQIEKRYGDHKETSETLSISGAYLVSPLWQVGGTLGYKYNSKNTSSLNESSTGVGDFKVQLAYEFLPEYAFSLWKPKGYIFVEQTIPFANSTFDAEKPLRTDSMGNGLYTTALGFSFVKLLGDFDALWMAEIHQGLSRSFSEHGEKFKVTPKLGYSTLFGLGYSPNSGDLRLGTTLLFSKEKGNKVIGDINSESISKHFVEVGVSASYLYKGMSYSVTYTDQTFLGEAENTPLTKSISLSMVKFFDL